MTVTRTTSGNSIVYEGGPSGQERAFEYWGVASVSASGVGEAGQLTLPERSYLLAIGIANGSAAAITGGLKIGTTSGGTEVVTAQTVAASTNYGIADTAISVRMFPSGATLFYDAVTDWNGANITLVVFYAQY